MNIIHRRLGFLKHSKIRKQLYTIYILAVLMPVTLIGIFLVGNTGQLLTNYHRDLLNSDNLRVRTILFEITTQIYNISEEISFNNEVISVLNGNYSSMADMTIAVNQVASEVDKYMYNYSEIDKIEIYCDNPNLYNYKQYKTVDSDIQNTDWYQRAISQSSIFWKEMVTRDKYGNEYWNLCLVRKIPLTHSDFQGVLVVRVSDNYLKTRINSQEYQIHASVDDGAIFYASNRNDYGKPQAVPIDYNKNYFQYSGTKKLDDKTCFVDVSTLHLYQSDSKIYICTLNDKSYENIMSILHTCIVIIALAMIVPGILVQVFTGYFTKRIVMLRHVMHQASNEDYEFEIRMHGDDEISEVFADLEILVQNIKEKDARMYEAMINEKELANEQQKMEFKMLASQINPHFLYNTLETIRMKAYTAGDKEAATAIKLLGKSMRYVLENNGVAFTALKNELNHIEIYMKIQKLRFDEKFDYQIHMDKEIDADKCMILPLLLQPIVENAIIHGLEEKEVGGMVLINVAYLRESENPQKLLEGNEKQTDNIKNPPKEIETEILSNNLHETKIIKIAISDNGYGMDKEILNRIRHDIAYKNPQKKEGIGLYNINQRVKLCYGSAYCMQIASTPQQGTTVSLLIPEKIS